MIMCSAVADHRTQWERQDVLSDFPDLSLSWSSWVAVPHIPVPSRLQYTCFQYLPSALLDYGCINLDTFLSSVCSISLALDCV